MENSFSVEAIKTMCDFALAQPLGPAKDKAFLLALKAICMLDPLTKTIYRPFFSEALGLCLRKYDVLLANANQIQKEESYLLISIRRLAERTN